MLITGRVLKTSALLTAGLICLGAAAQAETSRLKLELSTLEDPAWLNKTANELSLQSTVPVVEMSTVQ